MIGEVRLLNKDIVFRGKVWGKKGETVTVVSVSGNAVTFERKNGVRNPCNIKDLE